MIEIKKADIESEAAKELIDELNIILTKIVGEDGTYTKCGYKHCESFGLYKDNCNSYCFKKTL